MAYWKFISTWETEAECYARRLFGNEGREITKTGETLDVKEGDVLFLHRWRSDERGHLDGPFIAADDAQKEIVKDAWSQKKKDFDWQVPITWEETVYSRRIEDIKNQSDSLPAEIYSHPQKFTQVQGIWLAGAIKKGSPIISPL